MTKKDPVDIAATIRRSIEVSRKRVRRITLERVRDVFGFKAWSDERKTFVQKCFADANVVTSPSLTTAEPHEWIHLSLADDHPQTRTADPQDPPRPEFFSYLESLDLMSEREVEMHLVSPLFLHLGYDVSQEAAGFGFHTWHGSDQRAVEADLVYFADATHDIERGSPLVLVECKMPSKDVAFGTGQAKSYAYWIKPVYYVVTNGEWLTVYLYQGGAIPDFKSFETNREDLSADFAALYRLLNPATVMEAREQQRAKFSLQPFGAQTAQEDVFIRPEGS